MAEPGKVRAVVDQLRVPRPGIMVRRSFGTELSRIEQLEDTVDYLADYIDYLEARVAALDNKSDESP